MLLGGVERLVRSGTEYHEIRLVIRPFDAAQPTFFASAFSPIILLLLPPIPAKTTLRRRRRNIFRRPTLGQMPTQAELAPIRLGDGALLLPDDLRPSERVGQ